MNAERQHEAPMLLTIPQVCRELQIGRNTVYDLIARRELPAVRIGPSGRILRISRHALERWVESAQAAAS